MWYRGDGLADSGSVEAQLVALRAANAPEVLAARFKVRLWGLEGASLPNVGALERTGTDDTLSAVTIFLHFHDVVGSGTTVGSHRSFSDNSAEGQLDEINILLDSLLGHVWERRDHGDHKNLSMQEWSEALESRVSSPEPITSEIAGVAYAGHKVRVDAVRARSIVFSETEHVTVVWEGDDDKVPAIKVVAGA